MPDAVADNRFSNSKKRATRRSHLNRSALNTWQRQIRSFENRATGLTDQQIRHRAQELRESYNEHRPGKQLFEFAGLVAESVFRTNGFRLYDVQIRALAAATTGAIVEMQTGEGKTVVTGAIAAIQSLSSPSVHVGTTNTYLAARDLDSLTETFEMLGIGYGLLPEENNEAESRHVYTKQIVYGPGYQYGFDYLRDQMYLRENRQSQLGTSTVNLDSGNRSAQKPDPTTRTPYRTH